MERLMTLKETAAYLNIADSTLQKWCQRDFIPHFKVNKRLRLFSRAKVDAWLEQREIRGKGKRGNSARPARARGKTVVLLHGEGAQRRTR